MKKIYIYLTLFILSANIFGQNAINGTISDAKTGEKIPGAEVYIPGLKKGTVTNIDGVFHLKNIPNGKFKVIFSFLGYETQIKDFIFKSDTNIKVIISLKPTVIQTQEVVVSGGGYLSQHENAIKIESLNAQKISQSGELSLIKTMTKLPSVDAVSNGEGIATPVIRGLSTSNILVLNDGFRMENFQFSTNHPFMIDEAGVDHIEFIKGPASLLFGSDAIGGAINIISEKPAPVNSVKSDINIKYDSNTQGVSTNAGLRASGKKFFGGVRLLYKAHKDYTAGDGTKAINTRFNENSVKAFTGMNTKNGSFKLYFNHNKMNLGLPIPNISPDDDYKTDIWYQDLTNDMLSTKNVVFLNKLKLELNASFQNNVRKLHSSPDSPIETIVNMNLKTIQYELKNTYSFDENNTGIIAFQGMNQNNKNGDAPNHVLPDFSINDASVFGLFIHNAGKFSGQLGVRYSFRQINIPEMLRNIGDSVFTGFSENYNNLSYSVGGTYRLNDNILFRSNFASAFRSPNIAELSQNGMHGIRYEKGDINLKSQRNYEFDLSSHFHFDKIAFNLGGFVNKINNYIYLSPELNNDLNKLIYYYRQNNSQIYGLETSFDYSLNENINITESYSFIQAIQENGNYLPLIPQNKVKGDLSYKFKGDFLTGLKLTFSNEIAFAKNDVAPQELYSPAYEVFDFGISYSKQLTKGKLNLSFGVKNMFNEEYYDHLSALKGMYYNIGRNFIVGVRYSL